MKWSRLWIGATVMVLALPTLATLAVPKGSGNLGTLAYAQVGVTMQGDTYFPVYPYVLEACGSPWYLNRLGHVNSAEPDYEIGYDFRYYKGVVAGRSGGGEKYWFGDLYKTGPGREAVLIGAVINAVTCVSEQHPQIGPIHWRLWYNTSVTAQYLVEMPPSRQMQVANPTGETVPSGNGGYLETYCKFLNEWSQDWSELISSTLIPGSCWQVQTWT